MIGFPRKAVLFGTSTTVLLTLYDLNLSLGLLSDNIPIFGGESLSKRGDGLVFTDTSQPRSVFYLTISQ